MVASIAAGTTAGYYLAQSEYYLGGSEPSGFWIRGDPGLGICVGAIVEKEIFERLHVGIDAAGQSLLSSRSRTDRVPGYDLTFSAPKSVSVLWALADEELRVRIAAVQSNAVKAAIEVLERNAAFTRRGKGGIRSEPVVLSVAGFQHGEARPAEHEDGETFADPQLHTHAVILNLARRADGSVGTLDGRRLFAWKMAAGAVYHQALATGLQNLGCSICEIGRNGTFELDGVPTSLRTYFSARRTEVEAMLDEAGLTSAAVPAAASTMARASRSAKVAGARDRFESWRVISFGLGHAAEAVIDAAMVNGRHEYAQVAEKSAGQDRLAAVPEALTATESVFERRQLFAAVASALVGTRAGIERVEEDVDALVRSGQVIELGVDPMGERRCSTPEMIRIEREILSMTEALAGRPSASPDPGLVRGLIKHSSLSGEQIDAVLAATGPKSITVIEGAAGSGKTTSLQPIVAAHAAAGYRVVGAAMAWRIAHQLRDDLSIEARATDSWLAGCAAGQPFLDHRTLLIIDEAGQIPSRQMHSLLQEVQRTRAKLLLVGDRRQLQPIGAGGALSIVAHAVNVAHVDQIVRQAEPWARQAVMDLAAGRVTEAIKAYSDRGHIHLGNGPAAALKAMADAWEGARRDSLSPLLLARTHAQARHINREIRRRLRATGVVAGSDIEIAAVTVSGQSHLLPLAAGDQIRFLVRNDNLGVVNGSIGTITKVSIKSEAIRITAEMGNRTIAFSPSDLADASGRARLDHAYVSTVYSAQGLTADRAFVLLDAGFNRHDTYVALSRARGGTDIFIDHRALDTHMRAERPLSLRSSMPEPNDAGRLRWLGQRVSRAAIKGSTINLSQPSWHLAALVKAGEAEAEIT